MFQKIKPEDPHSVSDSLSLDITKPEHTPPPLEPPLRTSDLSPQDSEPSDLFSRHSSSKLDSKFTEGGALRPKLFSFGKEPQDPSRANDNLFRVQMKNAKEEFHANKLMWKVKFKTGVFVKFFFIHLLAHFFLPLVYVILATCYKRYFFKNLDFCGKESLHQMFLWTFQTLFIIYFVLYTPADNDYSMALNVVIGSLLRTFVIALKFAYMTVPDLNVIHSSSIPQREKHRHLLLCGWEVIRPMCAENEIKQAIERLQVEEEDFELNFMERPHYYFKERLEWQVTTDEDEGFDPAQYKKVVLDLMMKVKKCFDLAQIRGAQAYVTQFTGVGDEARTEGLSKLKRRNTAINYCQQPTAAELARRYSAKRVAREFLMMSLVQPRFGKILGFVSIMMLWSLPIITMGIGVSGWPLRTIHDYILCALAFPANYFIYYPNFQYLMVGVTDFRRKVFFMKCTSKLIDSLHNSNYTLLIPSLDLTCPDNLYNWFKLRRVLLSVGKRFTSRILSYLGCLLILSSFMLVLLLLQYFRLIQLNFSSLTYAYIIFYIVYVFFSCLAMMHLGVAVNLFFLKHIDRLRNFKLEFRRMIMKGHVSLAHLRDPHTVFFKQLKRMALLYQQDSKPDDDSSLRRPLQEKEQDDFPRLVEVLSDVIQGLEHEYDHNSLKMLGISLTPATMSTVWGFLFSILAAFISGNLDRN